MNIVEALTLARDHGKKVRPKCWPTGERHNNRLGIRNFNVIFWNNEVTSPRFFMLNPEGKLISGFWLQDELEFLGEWEVVE